MTSSVAETSTETLSDAGEAIVETAGDVSETVSDTLTDVVDATPDVSSDFVEPSSEILETKLDAVSVDIEPEIEAVDFEPEAIVAEIGTNAEAGDTSEFIEEPVHVAEGGAVGIEAPEMDLESTISAQLDSTLSTEPLDISPAEVSHVVAENEPSLEPQQENVLDSDGEDEMQRLLNELSNEAKEPAQ